MHKVFVSARMFAPKDEAFRFLEENGCEIVPNPFHGRILTEEELIQNIPGIHGLLLGLEKVNPKVLSHADSLKSIAKFGVGVDNIDIPAATERGICVSNVVGANGDAVADLTFGLMLAIGRSIPAGWNLVKSGGWKGFTGPEVWGKTLGIIGFGAIGKKVAQRAQGFNMKILAYDEYPNPEYCKQHNIEIADNLETLLKNSDFITLHLPLTATSKDLISTKELAMMKSTAYIINAARGGIINEDALYLCLKEKGIAGAALDVLETEPIKQGHKLLELDNIIITPHIAGFSHESIERTKKISMENLLAGLNGKKNENILNWDALKK